MGCNPNKTLDIGENRGVFTMCANYISPNASMHCEISFCNLYKTQALFDKLYNKIINASIKLSGNVKNSCTYKLQRCCRFMGNLCELDDIMVFKTLKVRRILFS